MRQETTNLLQCPFLTLQIFDPILPNQYKISMLPLVGPVAQRLEQRTHNSWVERFAEPPGRANQRIAGELETGRSHRQEPCRLAAPDLGTEAERGDGEFPSQRHGANARPRRGNRCCARGAHRFRGRLRSPQNRFKRTGSTRNTVHDRVVNEAAYDPDDGTTGSGGEFRVVHAGHETSARFRAGG